MSEETLVDAASGRGSGRLWAFVPAALLASLIAFQLWLARGALSDPSFAVEDDYYAKAVSWDAKMAQDRDNVRLGWHVDVDVVRAADGHPGAQVRIADRGGAPIVGARGDIEAFAIARSSRAKHATLVPGAPGEYQAALGVNRPGEWELRLTVKRDSDRFTSTLRRTIPAWVLTP